MVYLAKNALKDSPPTFPKKRKVGSSFPEKKVGGKVCPIKEISEKENIPFDYLEKIVLELERAGLVKAKKGVQGGYFLAKEPQRITAGEIVRVLESTVPVSCIGCQMARICSAKNVWDKVQDSLDSTLDSVTLKDLVK